MTRNWLSAVWFEGIGVESLWRLSGGSFEGFESGVEVQGFVADLAVEGGMDGGEAGKAVLGFGDGGVDAFLFGFGEEFAWIRGEEAEGDGGGEVVGNRAGGQFTEFCDLRDGFSCFELLKGVELGAGEAVFRFHLRWGRGGELVEGLFLVGGEVGFDFLHEWLAVVVELPGADAGDVEEIGFGLRVAARHVAEGEVSENDVGRDGFFFGEGFAEGAEGLEKCVVAGDIAGAGGCGWDFRGRGGG